MVNKRDDQYYEWLKTKKSANKTKPSDECYTPPAVYSAVAEYVKERFNITDEQIIRPFYPGGDYQNEDYTNKIVVDNPPFSILASILKFYNEKSIKYFLFAPALTALANIDKTGIIFANLSIKYDNNVAVRTCFYTNFIDGIEAEPELGEKIKEIQPLNKKKSANNQYDYRDFISSNFDTVVRRGVHLFISKEEIEKIATSNGHKMYGGGIRLSEDKAKVINEIIN